MVKRFSVTVLFIFFKNVAWFHSGVTLAEMYPSIAAPGNGKYPSLVIGAHTPIISAPLLVLPPNPNPISQLGEK